MTKIHIGINPCQSKFRPTSYNYAPLASSTWHCGQIYITTDVGVECVKDISSYLFLQIYKGNMFGQEVCESFLVC